MDLQKDLLIFNVDFNELDADEGRWVIASRLPPHASSMRVPEPGEAVWLEDDEGNQCPGIVGEIFERTLLVEPIWDRWVAVHATVEVSDLPSFTRAQELVC